MSKSKRDRRRSNPNGNDIATAKMGINEMKKALGNTNPQFSSYIRTERKEQHSKPIFATVYIGDKEKHFRPPHFNTVVHDLMSDIRGQGHAHVKGENVKPSVMMNILMQPVKRWFGNFPESTLRENMRYIMLSDKMGSFPLKTATREKRKAATKDIDVPPLSYACICDHKQFYDFDEHTGVKRTVELTYEQFCCSPNAIKAFFAYIQAQFLTGAHHILPSPSPSSSPALSPVEDDEDEIEDEYSELEQSAMRRKRQEINTSPILEIKKTQAPKLRLTMDLDGDTIHTEDCFEKQMVFTEDGKSFSCMDRTLSQKDMLQSHDDIEADILMFRWIRTVFKEDPDSGVIIRTSDSDVIAIYAAQMWDTPMRVAWDTRNRVNKKKNTVEIVDPSDTHSPPKVVYSKPTPIYVSLDHLVVSLKNYGFNRDMFVGMCICSGTDFFQKGSMFHNISFISIWDFLTHAVHETSEKYVIQNFSIDNHNLLFRSLLCNIYYWYLRMCILKTLMKWSSSTSMSSSKTGEHNKLANLQQIRNMAVKFWSHPQLALKTGEQIVFKLHQALVDLKGCGIRAVNPYEYRFASIPLKNKDAAKRHIKACEKLFFLNYEYWVHTRHPEKNEIPSTPQRLDRVYNP